MKINELKKYGLHLSIEWKKVLTCSSDIEDVTDKELQNIKSVTDYLDLDSVWQKHDVDDSDTISESERYTLIDNPGSFGYTTYSYFHMNMGWDGTDDGWYLDNNVLHPTNRKDIYVSIN